MILRKTPLIGLMLMFDSETGNLIEENDSLYHQYYGDSYHYYDEKGNVIETFSIGENDNIGWEMVYKHFIYNDNGKIVRKIIINEESPNIVKSTCELYDYDSGEMLCEAKKRELDRDGVDCKSPLEVLFYDSETGKVISKEYGQLSKEEISFIAEIYAVSHNSDIWREFKKEELVDIIEKYKNNIQEYIKAHKVNGFNNEELFSVCTNEKMQTDALESTKGRGEISDPDIALKTLKEGIGANVMEFFSPELRSNKDFVFKAIDICNDGTPLAYASESLQDDMEVVFRAIAAPVTRGGPISLLKYASEKLRANRYIVLAAVRTWGENLEFASDDLRNDKDVAIAAVQSTKEAYKYLSEELRDDEVIAFTAAKSEGRWEDGARVLQYASERLRDIKGLVEYAVSHDGTEYQFASDRLKADPDIAKSAIESLPSSIEYVNPEILTKAMIELTYKVYYKRRANYEEWEYDEYDEGAEDLRKIQRVEEAYLESITMMSGEQGERGKITLDQVSSAIDKSKKQPSK